MLNSDALQAAHNATIGIVRSTAHNVETSALYSISQVTYSTTKARKCTRAVFVHSRLWIRIQMSHYWQE